MIIYFSNIEIDLYSFYRKNLIVTPKIREKIIGHHTRLQESDGLFLSRAKSHFVYLDAMITRKILRSKDANAMRGNDLKTTYLNENEIVMDMKVNI